MIIYDKNGEIELSILYKTKEETYHVYNKDDYKKQTSYFESQMVISKQDIKSVLDNNITYSMVNTITYNLSQLLLKIHNDPVYSVNWILY